MKNYVLLLCLSILTTSCVSTSKKEQQPAASFPIIDAHIHTSFDNQPEETSGIVFSQDQLIKEFKDNNVIAAVSMNSYKGKGWVDFSKVQNNSTRVIHCVGIGLPPKYNEIEEGLKNKKYSCIKIYLGYVHAFAYDKVYRPLYSLAEKYNVPVVFHTGDTYSTKGKLKFADPLTIDEVAVDYPKVKFVIAHLGNPWIQSAAEVIYKNPNVYADVSAFLIGNLSDYSTDKLSKYVTEPISWSFGYIENPDKLMYGTDWPLTSIKDYIQAVKMAIPEKYWEKVFKTNAETVFNLK